MRSRLRPLSDILAALASLLAIVAALPYELGEVSLIISPQWKAGIAIAGAFATCALRVLRPYLPAPHPAPPATPIAGPAGAEPTS